MASKYELLASVVMADHENWVYMNQESGEQNHLVIQHVLRILHEYENGPRRGGPNSAIYGEEVAQRIYDQIALNYTTVDFDEPDAQATPLEERSAAHVVTDIHNLTSAAQLDIDS
jgi:hypothetical protein